MIGRVLVFLLCFRLSLVSGLGQYTHPAPQTLGQPWPLPQNFTQTQDTQTVNELQFQFHISGHDCDILQAALDRCYKHIFGGLRDTAVKFQPRGNPLPFFGFGETELLALDVNLALPCEKYPHLEMDESYSLSVQHGNARLHANSIWGALWGLETFSQIVYEDDAGGYRVNMTEVIDSPRFSHRGVLLDSSRHFLPKETIMQNLEAMAFNKMNVFHWHIVDDQSFPYQSPTFPDLSNKGAYHPYTHVYTQEDIAEIIEFARIRGIRVIPEFDSPGHTESWGKGTPNLLTKCYTNGTLNGEYGPIDPTVNSTYTFMKAFMAEVAEVFPDKYLHLGGDEVSFNCWKSSPVINAFMEMMGFNKSYAKLEEYYEQRLLDIVASLNKGYIVWQEVVDNGVKVKSDTVVHVWRGGQWKELEKVTKKNLRALLSSCWYLNRISMGADWKNFYKCDPHNFNGTDIQKALVIGGEMCLWGEYIDATNLISRTWPRGCAVAERLWSHKNVSDSDVAQPRLNEQRCRLISRGLQAEPVDGPSFCRHEYIQFKRCLCYP